MADTRRTTTGRRVPAPAPTATQVGDALALPPLERIQQELAGATSMDDFFGKEGIFARLVATTLEHMLEAELTAHLGYDRYAADGRNSGNNRNGTRPRKLRTSAGDTTIAVPRDRNGSFQSPLLEPYQTSTNELEEKIIALYAKGLSVRDMQATLQDIYGVELSAGTISTVTDKVWELVEAWQNRPLAAIYPIVYLDAIHLKLRRDGKTPVANHPRWGRGGQRPPQKGVCGEAKPPHAPPRRSGGA